MPPADYRRPALYRAVRWTYRHVASPVVDPLVRLLVRIGPGRSRGRTFSFAGREHAYCDHLHNRTWRNERCVEIPIVKAEVDARPGARVLEIGNVLGYYQRYPHDTIDKYEPHPGGWNEDIVDFRTDRPYDLVVSVSTLEHVGFDEEVRDSDKVLRAVEAVRRLLAPGGVAVVTLPLGYNPSLDEHLAAGRLRFDRVGYLRRVNAANRWVEASADDVRGAAYDLSLPSANALVVGWLDAGMAPEDE